MPRQNLRETVFRSSAFASSWRNRAQDGCDFGARLCPKDQPQQPAIVLRLVGTTRPRSLGSGYARLGFRPAAAVGTGVGCPSLSCEPPAASAPTNRPQHPVDHASRESRHHRRAKNQRTLRLQTLTDRNGHAKSALGLADKDRDEVLSLLVELLARTNGAWIFDYEEENQLAAMSNNAAGFKTTLATMA